MLKTNLFRTISFISFVMYFGGINLLQAQDIALQVMTKTIEKEIPFEEGQYLKIEGEKSEVDIISWDKDYIDVKVQMISKHPELAVAKEDIQHLYFETVIHKKEILLRDTIADTGSEIRSGLKAIYSISVPKNCKIELSNYFGQANITDLSHGLEVNSEFCNVQLENIAGHIKVDTYYGDLIGVMINGDMNLSAKRSNVTLSEISGKFDIKAYKGIVKIFANQAFLDLNIDAEKTDVFFYDSSLSAYNFNLKSRNGGAIDLPDNLLVDYNNTPNIKNAIIKPDTELSGIRVAINVSYGDIKIASN